MARNLANRPALVQFAALLDGHLKGGTRPSTATGEPWKNVEFAQEVVSPREFKENFSAAVNSAQVENTVSDRSVANWRKGSSLPAAIEPILRALFGPPSSQTHSEARTALRDAFIAAQTESKSSPAVPSKIAVPPRSPAETMPALSWQIEHAWQSMGLAELIVGHPVMLNDRDAYTLRVSVSFRPTSIFTVGNRTFAAGLRSAQLEPDYHNCHPEPGTRPGEAKEHDYIAVLGGVYQFSGPKDGGDFLSGNPFGMPAEPTDPGDRDPIDDVPSTLPFANIAWDKPGTNWVELRLISEKHDLEIRPYDPSAAAVADKRKPLSKAKEKLIQHYLREIQAKQEQGKIHWARATLRGRVRK